MHMVTVIGLGFVGLTTSLGIASLGTTVFGYDVNKQRSEKIKQCEACFGDPIIAKKLQQMIGKSFWVVENLREAVAASDCIFICVGTPSEKDGSVDLDEVVSAVNSCLEVIPHDGIHRTIVIKSTVPPGTCDSVISKLVMTAGFDPESLSIASNPEFLREGHCWEDFMNPGRIVIGTDDVRAQESLHKIYEKIEADVFNVTPRTAEFSKYLSNVMLASMISFSNEMAYAAEIFGNVDIRASFEVIQRDPRIMGSGIAAYLYPGCGYGGYCLPKDTMAFNVALKEQGYNSCLIEDVIKVNDMATIRLCNKITRLATPSDCIGILGLAFKKDTVDVRNSVSEKIIRLLLDRGYSNICAFDPKATENFKMSNQDINIDYCITAKELICKAEVIVLVTDWDIFRELDYSGKILVDGRYMLEQIKKGND